MARIQQQAVVARELHGAFRGCTHHETCRRLTAGPSYSRAEAGPFRPSMFGAFARDECRGESTKWPRTRGRPELSMRTARHCRFVSKTGARIREKPTRRQVSHPTPEF